MVYAFMKGNPQLSPMPLHPPPDLLCLSQSPEPQSLTTFVIHLLAIALAQPNPIFIYVHGTFLDGKLKDKSVMPLWVIM